MNAPVKASAGSAVPGVLLMAAGALIIYEPALIRWIFGGFLVLMGLVVMTLGRKMSRARARMHNARDQFAQRMGDMMGAMGNRPDQRPPSPSPDDS